MDFNFIWQAVLIVLIGTILLRVAGRKTISEMTLAETVLMISIGTLIIQPVTSKSVWKSFLVGGILVATLLILEYIQIKSDRMEKLITGKSKVVIENGVLNEKELVKLGLTVDQLEMHLRQNNVASIGDVELGTLEPSGQLGYTLKQAAQPATKQDIQALQESINQLLSNQSNYTILDVNESQKQQSPHKNNIFKEVKSNGHTQDVPEHLQ